MGARDLRILGAAICLSALGDGVALVALALRAKELAGSGMGSGISIAALFICLWAPLVVLAGHVGLLVDRVESRGLLIVTSMAQAVVAVVLAFVGSLAALLGLAAGMLVGSNVLGRRVAVSALAAATFAGVVVQGLGRFLAPLWLVFGFMLVTYFVGGVGHGLKNVTSRTLIHTHVPSDRHGRAFAVWNGLRNGAELGALAVGGVLVGLLGARSMLWLAGGLSALAGIVGLLVLASWRARAEVGASPGTIGSP